MVLEVMEFADVQDASSFLLVLKEQEEAEENAKEETSVGAQCMSLSWLPPVVEIQAGFLRAKCSRSFRSLREDLGVLAPRDDDVTIRALSPVLLL